MRSFDSLGKHSFLMLALLAAGTFATVDAHAAAKKSHKKPAVVEEADDADDLEYDPIEPVNRGIFQFNFVVDKFVLRPVTVGYRTVVPEQGRTMVSNAVTNIYSPVVFVNSVLQGDGQNSLATLWRFLINSTFGIAGLFDPATSIGLTNRDTDMGETFAVYGAQPGAYVVLPLIGPSNVRDGFGHVGDILVNPVTYMDDAVTYSVAGVTAVDKRSNNMKLLDDVYGNSLDSYTMLRSIYTQHRAQEVKKAIAARNASIAKSSK